MRGGGSNEDITSLLHGEIKCQADLVRFNLVLKNDGFRSVTFKCRIV